MGGAVAYIMRAGAPSLVSPCTPPPETNKIYLTVINFEKTRKNFLFFAGNIKIKLKLVFDDVVVDDGSANVGAALISARAGEKEKLE